MKSSATSAQDFARPARAALPADVWDYVQGGAGTESTVRANRRALRRLRLRQRVLVDVSSFDPQVTVQGSPVAAPIGIAPTAYHRLVHADGELATVRAAGRQGLPAVVSTFASVPLEQLAEVATAPLWFQLYCFRDRALTVDLARRAEAAGYRALVLTVDTPVMGYRDRDLRNDFRVPPQVTAANLPSYPHDQESVAARTGMLVDPATTWRDVEWLAGLTGLPVVLKGVMTAGDAARAAGSGARALWVSNHGGRQLDGAAASIDALGEVADAWAGRGELYFDGGVRRGADVLKALAVGADAVFVGRPVLWALAAGGEPAVRRMLELLQEEFVVTATVCGCPRVKDVDRSMLCGAYGGGCGS
ncbi:alpha-hydroxy acid oxidase [Micromonospora sp. NPDC050980]|uniref:alpha-hydroxy acid oxidase n=1 Tax=Micromonospora sp. NPDC050980 TaxID=3155161 RepID=UPI0033DA8D0D